MLIGISGVAGSGKDTVCDILIKNGIINKRYALADPIKDICGVLFDWNDDHKFGDLKETDCPVKFMNRNAFTKKVKEYRLDQFGKNSDLIYLEFMKQILKYIQNGFISPRRAFQIFGTEVGRDFIDKDIWLKIADIEQSCIPDIRFPNESQWLKDNEGVLIWVHRDNTTPVFKHESEQYVGQLNHDHLIVNDGSLEELEKKVLEIFGC